MLTKKRQILFGKKVKRLITLKRFPIRLDRDEVFVKGYEIKDLHHLDKNYIYTLNVCATQELYKLIMEQREEINNLKNRLSILESINNSQ